MVYASVRKKYYCGIDLHAQNMTVAVIRDDGKVMTHRTLKNEFQTFTHCILPYSKDIAIGLEATFNWYWFVDRCREENLDIYLGHPGYMKAIQVDKHKSDYLDSEKIANLLRTGMFPVSYAYERNDREVRDLLRRRLVYVHLRASLAAHVKISLLQYGHCDLSGDDIRALCRRDTVLERFHGSMTEFSAMADYTTIDALTESIKSLEDSILKHTHGRHSDELDVFMAAPGIGKIIALTIIYETGPIARFRRRQNYSSYCRCVNPLRESAGKRTGMGNGKIGNPYLKCAYMEILTNAPSVEPRIDVMYALLKEQHEPLKARAIMANRFCTAAYYMLKRREPFDIERFCNRKP